MRAGLNAPSPIYPMFLRISPWLWFRGTDMGEGGELPRISQGPNLRQFEDPH